MPRSLVHESSPSLPAASNAILAKGFRPFFFLAALHAVLSVPLWIASLALQFGVGGDWSPLVWHAHEMLFGFTAAVIAGFLLTAAGNWTSRETATGGKLLGLALLWCAGRVLAVLGHPWGAAADAAFFGMFALVIAVPILAARSRRNYLFPLMILALGAGDLWLHSAAQGSAALGMRFAPLRALDVVVVMIVLVTARIVPMFTRNALQLPRIRNRPALDRVALVGVIGLAVLGAAQVEERFLAVLAAFCGLMLLLRMRTWGSLASLRQPLVWILHVGHTFLALGLLLRGAAAYVPALPSSMWTHSLTAGAIGSLTLGMMSRVTLGHTGRMLAPPRIVAVGFGATAVGALLRILAPLAGTHQLGVLIAAATLWSLGFASFLFAQSPMLFAPRVDGRPG
ncbi:MAG: NnrS family protein [Polyangiaceae bacterium]